MRDTLFIEALIHTAKKCKILDRAQAARLHTLMTSQGICDVKTAREWIHSSGLVTARIAKSLLERLPKSNHTPYGAYTPLTHLADGGMGSVYLAASPANELVVIKTMRGNLSGNTEVVHRFLRESRYMMELKHPNIVACLDQGQSDSGELFIILEFVPSGDLKELTMRHKGLYEAIGLGVIYQIADALSLAHQKNLVHRDIKPPNIFVDYNGKAQLADFGIARSTNEQRTMLTMQGALVGSPYYMSPEQVLADPHLDIRSDIYALGAVLYYCMSGTEPFKGTLQEVLHAHRTAPTPDVRAIRPEITARSAAIIQRCMQKKREDRYRDPIELRQAVLEAIAAIETPGAVLQAVINSINTDATIDADFSAIAKTPPADDQATAATIAFSEQDDAPRTPATMATPGDFQATVAMSPNDWAHIVPDRERMEGDTAHALNTPWISLTGDGVTLLLYAKTSLLLGKLCEDPVDICLRKYPINQFRSECLRISRQHLKLEYSDGKILVTDLGSGNGTTLANKTMSINTPHTLSIGTDHAVHVAGALQLCLKPLAREGQAFPVQGAPPSAATHGGLDRDHSCDAVIITRPDNHSTMIYAQVLRRVSIGGPSSSAMIRLPNASSAFEIGIHGGIWIWRSALGNGPWSPLKAETRITTGTMHLIARTGDYDVFQ